MPSSFELAAGVLFNADPVSRVVDVFTSGGVLAPIVLKDTVLLPFLDALPISLEGDVEQCVASEHELCWGGACGSVYQ